MSARFPRAIVRVLLVLTCAELVLLCAQPQVAMAGGPAVVREDGYGRYVMRVDQDVVVVDGKSYKVTRSDDDLLLGGHKVMRGIYREQRPWLYVHRMTADTVDVTFDEGTTPARPLSTGAAGPILDPYGPTQIVEETAIIAFPCQRWLVANWWTSEGIFFDLVERKQDGSWKLIKPDDVEDTDWDGMFVDKDRVQVGIQEIGTELQITTFDFGRQGAVMTFTYDRPSAPCFVDGPTWDPQGRYIQQVAIATLGTRVSCVPSGGQPFYQMRMGLGNWFAAELRVAMLQEGLLECLPSLERQAWCSETISYWHMRAGIPYPEGYRTDWNQNWQLGSTGAIKNFYKTEEELIEQTKNEPPHRRKGRARWIGWNELDYANFRAGRNAPGPGSYVLIRRPGDWKTSHSMMINEMTMYRMPDAKIGEVEKVEVSLLEGNSGSPPQVREDRRIDDLLTVTHAGPYHWRSRRKIEGFGVDLNKSWQANYDWSRLHVRSARVHFFTNNGYGGDTFFVELSDEGNLAAPFDDAISSIKIDGNYIVELFEQRDFKGARLTLGRGQSHRSLSNPNLTPPVGNWNNRISSYRVRPAQVRFFKHINYRGEQLSIREPQDYGVLHHIRLNNAISSIAIDGDYVVEVFDQPDFGGNKLTLTQNEKVDDLRDVALGQGKNWNDRISSLRVRVAEVCLFSNINYEDDEGHRLCLKAPHDEADLSGYAFQEKISSVAINGNYVVELFDQANFTGTKLTLEPGDSEPDLRNRPYDTTEDWNDRAMSLRIRVATKQPGQNLRLPVFDAKPVEPESDPLVAELARYALRRDGIVVRSSSSSVRVSGIPDGGATMWVFPAIRDPAKAPAAVEIEIDLREEHPLPIHGVMLTWNARYVPRGYSVQWAGADNGLKRAIVPQVAPSKSERGLTRSFSIPVPFASGESSAKVRYVRLTFPAKAFSRNEQAILQELRFLYDWGPDLDAEVNP